MKWDESKHPRDKDGKFTDGSGGFRQNATYKDIIESLESKIEKTEDSDTWIIRTMCEILHVPYTDNAKDVLEEMFSREIVRDEADELPESKQDKKINDSKVEKTNDSQVVHEIYIPREHYSRLMQMFSDYHLGTCKPVEKHGFKYFVVDNTVYIASGEYPYIQVNNSILFGSARRLEKWLKLKMK